MRQQVKTQILGDGSYKRTINFSDGQTNVLFAVTNGNLDSADILVVEAPSGLKTFDEQDKEKKEG